MTGDRPKVGEAFRAPDRANSLTGLLREGPSGPAAGSPPLHSLPQAPLPEDRRLPGAADSPPPRGDPGRRDLGQTRTAPARTKSISAVDAGLETRVVPVVVDVSILTDLRSFAVRTEQTHGAVTLRAIEANADDLSKHWMGETAAPSLRSAPGQQRLFGNRTTAHRRRAEPGVQTQLRISAADADTLDRLVGMWSAPSRSALVNEALRRYVRLSADNAPTPAMPVIQAHLATEKAGNASAAHRDQLDGA